MVILALCSVLALAMAAAAFADPSGQSSFPGGGQFQNMMQNEFIQALASASNQTTTQIQQDMTANNETLPQVAQQLAQAGTITQASLAAAIQQVLAATDQTRANNQAQALISGQTPSWQGNPGQSGSAPPSGQNGQGSGQNGWSGNRQQGNSMIIQALATASNQTTTQIQQDMTNGQTLTQIAQQLAQAGTITQASLAAAILQIMESNDQTRAATDAQELISGQMPGRQGGTQGGSSPSTGTATGNGIVLTIGSPRMFVRGVAQDIDPGYQTQPVINNGRTFVPIKAIIEALGGTVAWNPANQQVAINLNNTSMVFSIGSTNATINGSATALDQAPYISSTSRTMLPLRFIMEQLGGHTVNWDSNNRTITIQ
jgi:mannitol/fructose-specific phosphotransferase system IIA component (Ntr-type)